MSKQLIVLWGTIYIVLAIPVAMLAGRLIFRADLPGCSAVCSCDLGAARASAVLPCLRRNS